MSYADQPAMSPRKAVSIGLVVLLHAIIGYAFITGLAYNVIKKAATDLTTVDVKDEPPPPEVKPPPPPPEQKFEPPPIVAPPAIVQTQTIAAPVLNTAPVAPPVAAPVITPAAPPAPPPPPAPVAVSLKQNLNSLFSTDDYPPSSLRNEEEGTVGFHLVFDATGKVTSCSVTSSSGHPALDDASCRLLTRRARATPPASGPAAGGVYNSRFTWKIPKD